MSACDPIISTMVYELSKQFCSDDGCNGRPQWVGARRPNEAYWACDAHAFEDEHQVEMQPIRIRCQAGCDGNAAYVSIRDDLVALSYCEQHIPA